MESKGKGRRSPLSVDLWAQHPELAQYLDDVKHETRLAKTEIVVRLLRFLKKQDTLHKLEILDLLPDIVKTDEALMNSLREKHRRKNTNHGHS